MKAIIVFSKSSGGVEILGAAPFNDGDEPAVKRALENVEKGARVLGAETKVVAMDTLGALAAFVAGEVQDLVEALEAEAGWDRSK